MPTPARPQGCIDDVIASCLPSWLTQAPAQRLVELNTCLQAQQAVQQKLQVLLGGITPLDAFAAPLLQRALSAQLARLLDVRKATLRLHLLERYPVSRGDVPGAVRERTLQHSLLAAALHNFGQGETLSLGLTDASELLDANGKTLPMTARAFAGLCRTLDIGGQYQAYLKARLSAPGDTGERVAALLEHAHRHAFEAALRLAALKGDIGETALLQCLTAITSAPGVATRMRPVALRILGKRVRGAVAFELHRDDGGKGQLEGVLCWLPDDPQGAMTWYASWEALFQTLGKLFRLPGYPQYFQRFVSERDREPFSVALVSAMAQGGAHAPVELDGRHEVIRQPLFKHLRKTQLDTLFDDAQVLAVPTGVQDSLERDRRLHFYARVGLDLLGLASFYVPSLGLPLLAIAALQVVDDVYEGYVDWQLGDRQGALAHALGVAANVGQLAVGTAVGVATETLLPRSSFVDTLAPVSTALGERRLIDPSLQAYALAEREAAVGQRVSVAGKAYLRTHQAAYRVTGELAEDQLYIQHPTRAEAYTPQLRHHGDGAWRHELETPQDWQGVTLLQRLGSGLAEVDERLANQVMLATGFDEARLRLLHVQEGNAPARLLDALQRQQLHSQFPALQGAAFEHHVAQLQVASSSAEQLLLRDFTGLTARGAREIVAQADETLVERMVGEQRVPLQLAEQARWWVRDSRLDRACAGLHQAPAVTADTERLALGLLRDWLPWPGSLRLELRDSRLTAPLLAQVGDLGASEVRVIEKGAAGYLALGAAGQPLAGAGKEDCLMQALLWQLSETQRALLGAADLSAEQLAQALAQRAFDKREGLATLLGMAPIGTGVRPPVRLADGRLGYPLSGRGESSSEALRQALRRLFPTYSDSQVEEFLASSSRFGMTPWNRYYQLLEQSRQLENTLTTWRRESASRVQALRRSWVARTIRRAWQRLSHDAHGNYALYIHGWRVGALPRLPESVDFSHVTHLSLRNMSLVSIDASFLQRFSGVRRLDLRGNVLLEVPAGIEHLAELEVLHLAENHIALNAASERRIAALRRLHSLNLNSNLLGRAPEVSGLLRLRSLYLRATDFARCLCGCWNRRP
ncbi:leucine-rich repeat domain-containing protein [Pseudomonas sp. Leaf58]|uniref:leucine-rich repeat domain-containing protein n=1 Tax=Pseudomonas sp. Leaf58 TaxID=1736226 RepID=UPI00070031BC|nr:leucine-rich repeat domain-containing protein [Pseudomonas sp. Leaf58]AYG44513.1 leucine-rich repeat domain-containing protein [Pseudomonas sp. Leaf58]KQN61184.1 hypothetical protein ASF02_12440 [Pseudomonas sp. Leaf58]